MSNFHCCIFSSVGCGRSGLFCAVYAGVQQIDMGQGIPSVPELVQRLWQKRKFLIEDKQQYQFIYQAILYHGQDLLMKRQYRFNYCKFSVIWDTFNNDKFWGLMFSENTDKAE